MKLLKTNSLLKSFCRLYSICSLLLLSIANNTYACNDDASSFKKQIRADVVHEMSYFGRKILGQGEVVAVLDSGVNILHPDMKQKVAFNKDEVLGDGIDNDGNGKIDDYKGWNFKTNTGSTFDDNGHGTHVASTIVANDYGIAPLANVVPIKVTTNPEGAYSDIYLKDAIKYAADEGAKIINLSLRGFYPKKATYVTRYVIREAIEYAGKRGVLVVVAAGNDKANITNAPILPAGIQEDHVITVCAVDKYNQFASFSNFSSLLVDLCAPGSNILAANAHFSLTSNIYGKKKVCKRKYLSGTSMATPIVSGVAALLRSMDSRLTPAQLKRIIVKSARQNKKMGLIQKQVSRTNGVVDALLAVQIFKSANY